MQIYCAENQHNKIIYSILLKINLVVWFWAVSLHHQINEIMTTKELHKTIKSKLTGRTNEQLLSDAKVARANKTDETQRMIFALIMDVLSTRMSETEFDVIYDQMTA